MAPPSTRTSRKIDAVQETQLSLTQCNTNETNIQETQCDTSGTNTPVAHLSYRQNRRLQQARRAELATDPEAEANLQALKDLHHKEIEENGVDNLTPQEAYPKVFKSCNGYIRGFGFGPRCSKRQKGAAEVREEIQQIQQASAEREASLRSEIERLKQEMIDRENKLRQDMMAEMAKMLRGST